MNRKLLWMPVLLVCLGLMIASCAGMKSVTPTASNFQTPVVTLQSFEVPQYDGFWFYGAKEKPTQGDAGNHGAPLPMSFVFEVKNPNPYPVLLQGIRYTVALDKDFDVVTYNDQDAIWIPAGKTNQVRTTTMITVASAQLSVMVTGGFKLKEMGLTPWQALEKWWKGVPDYTVPVTVKDGSFTFSADGIVKVVPVTATVS